MKSYVVAYFHNGVIIDYKRKPKADIPEPHSLKVATNAVKRLNEELAKHRENYPRGSIGRESTAHWGVVTIDRLAELNRKAWASHRATVGNE